MNELAVSSLCKSFGAVRAVDDVSFSVAAGEFLALIGPNGAGKSTCFNTINGQLKPDSGGIRFAGGGGVVTPWPSETPLSLDQRMAAQNALTKLGYSPGVVDGMVGAGTRQALRAWQKSQGLPADGYLSVTMVERLRLAAARA